LKKRTPPQVVVVTGASNLIEEPETIIAQENWDPTKSGTPDFPDVEGEPQFRGS
jgi:hypothetical protein